MARAKPWFRIHNNIVDNPKIQRLPDGLVLPWLNLVAIANGNGGTLPPIEDVAFRMRVSETKCETLLETFQKRRLFDKTERGWEPHDWNDWQYQSDVSTDRVKKFRERQRNSGGNVSETAEETDQRQSRDRAEVHLPSEDGAHAGGKRKKKSRLPADWTPTPQHTAHAENLNLTAEEMAHETQQFREYFNSSDARMPLKSDWGNAFTRWLTRSAPAVIARRPRGGRSTGNSGNRPSATAIRDQLRAEAGIQRPSGDGDDHEVPTDRRSFARGIGFGADLGGSVDDTRNSGGIDRLGDGIEIDHEAVSGGGEGPTGAVENLHQQGGELPGGRGPACAENPIHLQPVVAVVAGAPREVGTAHVSPPDDADSLEIPSFLRRVKTA